VRPKSCESRSKLHLPLEENGKHILGSLSVVRALVVTFLAFINKTKAQLQQLQNNLSLATHHNMILTLMGVNDTSKSFAMLDGNIYSDDDLLQYCLKREKLGVVHGVHSNKLFLAFFFKRYDEAALMAEKYRSRKLMRFLDVYHIFFEGLTALQLARRKDSNEHKWIEVAEQAISAFMIWESHCNWNNENKLMLLQAELHFVKGKLAEAEERYEASVLSAQRHRFVHEEGLAMELSGMFYRAIEREDEAKKQLLGARHCYEQWGAIALVNQLG
jgi:hypothetical protein